MNIIDLRNRDIPIDQNSKFERITKDTLEFLKDIIPSKIKDDSTEIVKSIHNLVWQKGIPVYLIDESKMPYDFSEDVNSPEYFGYYKNVELDNVNLDYIKCESIFICMDRIQGDKQLLSYVIIHELGHALMEAGVEDFGYNHQKNDIIKFMEESLTNYLVLRFFNDIGQKEMLNYSYNSISEQGFGYNFGINWFKWNNDNHQSWINIKKNILVNDQNRSFEGIICNLDNYKIRGGIVCSCDNSTKCKGTNVEFKKEMLKILDEISNFCEVYEGYFERKDKAAHHCDIIDL